MKKSKYLVLLIVAMSLILCGCSSKTKIYKYPLELITGEDSKNLSNEDLDALKKQIKGWSKDDICESAAINNENMIIIRFTDKQLKKEIDTLKSEIGIDNNTRSFLVESAKYYVSEDFRGLSIELKNNSSIVVKPYVQSMLMLQILNDIPVDKAKVIVSYKFSDTENYKDEEFTVYNFYK